MNLSWAAFVGAISLTNSAAYGQDFKGSNRGRRGLQNDASSKAGKGDTGRTGSNFSTVYTMTNLPENGIQIYSRNEQTGELTYEGTEPTNGSGGGPFGGETDTVVDFLNSNYPIIVAGRCLLTVNAISNDISTFHIRSQNRLDFSDKVSSGGTLPVAFAERDGLVYVLNVGGQGSIQGFDLHPGNCNLSPIGGSIELDQPEVMDHPMAPRFTFAAPSQIGFTPDGDILVLMKAFGGNGAWFTDAAEGVLNKYTINPDGTTSAESLEQITVAGPRASPYGFEFDDQGRMILAPDDWTGPTGIRLFDQDLNQVQAVVAQIDGDGPSIFGACWVKYNPSNQCVYITNSPNNNMSTLRLREDLEFVHAIAATSFFPIDIELSPDNRFLYQANCDAGTPGMPQIHVYEMTDDCGVVEVQTTSSGTPIGCVQGIALFSGAEEPSLDTKIAPVVA